MADQAYSSWETIINESIVRGSCSGLYEGKSFSQAEINNENERANFRSFIWTPELVKLLKEISEFSTENNTLIWKFSIRVLFLFSKIQEKTWTRKL